MEITQWDEPTNRRDNSGASWGVAETLKAHQGTWAIIEEKVTPEDPEEARKQRAASSNRASLIKQGRLAPFKPKGVFEAVSRTGEFPQRDASGAEVLDGDGNVVKINATRVFARYLGEEYAKPEKTDEEKAADKAAREQRKAEKEAKKAAEANQANQQGGAAPADAGTVQATETAGV